MFTTHPDHPELNEHLRYLGYWRIMDKRYTRDPRPHPKDFVDLAWDDTERARVVQYLQAGTTLYEWLGSSTCRFCGLRPNGTRCLTDGVFAWPEGFAHYVAFHGVRPPAEFTEQIRRGRHDVQPTP